MSALAATVSPPASPQAAGASIPCSVEALSAILYYYGFDFFFERTLRMINLENPDYADAVDDAIERFRDEDLNAFTLRRAFRLIVADLRAEDGLSYDEALEYLAEEDYVVPVTTAMAYSVDAGEADVDYLSKLVRNRAKRLLKQHRRSRTN